MDSVGKVDSSLCAWRTKINTCSLPPKTVVAWSVIDACLTGTPTHTELILSLAHNPISNDKQPYHCYLPSHDDCWKHCSNLLFTKEHHDQQLLGTCCHSQDSVRRGNSLSESPGTLFPHMPQGKEYVSKHMVTQFPSFFLWASGCFHLLIHPERPRY